jgi:DNA-binding response OmpR family regulator
MNTRILAVDDNEDLLQITQIILKAQGYDIFTATTIEDAGRKLKIHHPVLLLLDVSVCEHDDGRIYCQQLKEEAATKGIRIILMSGNEYDSTELGKADDFLLKPFDFTELTEKVAKQIEAAQDLVLTAV